MAGRHIRYNVASNYFEYSTTGLEAGPFTKVDLSGHTEVAPQAFKVGAIYTNITGVNPGTELGYGTWVALAAGRVLVGFDAGQVEFDTVRETGGAKTHALTTAELAAHNHGVTDPGHTHTTTVFTQSGGGASDALTVANNVTEKITDSAVTGISIQNAGSGNAHNNLQPYYTVHFWERTA